MSLLPFIHARVPVGAPPTLTPPPHVVPSLVTAPDARSVAVRPFAAHRSLRQVRADDDTTEQRDTFGNRNGFEIDLVPKHAPVEDTELAGKLVWHTGQVKAVVDTIRIVSTNIEADLADMIAPHMRCSKEAKKVIANLFAAPVASMSPRVASASAWHRLRTDLNALPYVVCLLR